MKKLSILTILFCILFSACSDNDDKSNVIIPGPPIGTEVRYEVEADADIITDIKFRKPDGTLMDGTLSVDIPNQWSFTIIVNTPFSARVEAEFVNPTGSAVNGAMDIYVNGVLAAHDTVLVLANGNTSQDLEFLVE